MKVGKTNLEQRAKSILNEIDSSDDSPRFTKLKRSPMIINKTFKDKNSSQKNFSDEESFSGDSFKENIKEPVSKIEYPISKNFDDDNDVQDVDTLKKQLEELKKNEKVLVQEIIKQQELAKTFSQMRDEESHKIEIDKYQSTIASLENQISELKKENEDLKLQLNELISSNDHNFEWLKISGHPPWSWRSTFL